MEKEFIPYEQALALKELGFDEYCLGLYSYASRNTIDMQHVIHTCKASSKLIWMRVPTPTFSQAFRWFREKYELLNNLTTHLNPYGEDGALEESYGYRIMFNKDGWKCDVWEELIFDSYGEAELACLAKLIEIAKEMI